jgi:hypothetical protein
VSSRWLFEVHKSSVGTNNIVATDFNPLVDMMNEILSSVGTIHIIAMDFNPLVDEKKDMLSSVGMFYIKL